MLIFTDAPFVPSDFIPRSVSRGVDFNTMVLLECPFHKIGNPLPYCTWNRIDSNNVTHQLALTDPDISSAKPDSDTPDDMCDIFINKFREVHNGLYQCTGHNAVGNTTYTFPERFIVESEYV